MQIFEQHVNVSELGSMPCVCGVFPALQSRDEEKLFLKFKWSFVSNGGKVIPHLTHSSLFVATSQNGSTRYDALISRRLRQRLLDEGRGSGWLGGCSGTVWHSCEYMKKDLEVCYLQRPSACLFRDTDKVPALMPDLSNLKRGRA